MYCMYTVPLIVQYIWAFLLYIYCTNVYFATHISEYSCATPYSFLCTTTLHHNTLHCRYAHYDNKASFSDFSSFGGWKSPHAKQYQGDVTQCRYTTV